MNDRLIFYKFIIFYFYNVLLYTRWGIVMQTIWYYLPVKELFYVY